MGRNVPSAGGPSQGPGQVQTPDAKNHKYASQGGSGFSDGDLEGFAPGGNKPKNLNVHPGGGKPTTEADDRMGDFGRIQSAEKISSLAVDAKPAQLPKQGFDDPANRTS